MKKWASLGLILMMLVGMTGCGAAKDVPEAQPPQTPQTIGLLVCTGQITDGQFNGLLAEGLESLGQPVVISTPDEGGERTLAERLDQLIADGATLIWGSEPASAEVILPAAEAHPERKFVIHDAELSELPDNVASVSYRSWEGAFLAGYAAGLITETEKVGMLGGRDETVIQQFEIGYNAGVQYAAEELGKTIEVYTIYAGMYDDPAMGQQLASIMYRDDCDVIFQAAGETGLGAIAEAKAQQKFIIGTDSDQSSLAPEQVLLSVTKGITAAAAEFSQAYLDGDFPSGQHLAYGLAEGGVDIAVNDIVSVDIGEKLTALKQQIISGELVIPSDQAGYDAFIAEL